MKLIKDLGVIFHKENHSKRSRCGIYECPDCLTHFQVQTTRVKTGKTKRCRSCASRKGSTKHGMSKERLYHVWASEKTRCRNKKDKWYDNYGGRGILFSEEFDKYEDWREYVLSLDNANKDGYSLDRINNNGNYERGNLRWVSNSIQSRNTRIISSSNSTGYRGVTKRSKGKPFEVNIKVDNVQIYLGRFDTAKEGALAYDNYVLSNGLEHSRNFK